MDALQKAHHEKILQIISAEIGEANSADKRQVRARAANQLQNCEDRVQPAVPNHERGHQILHFGTQH